MNFIFNLIISILIVCPCYANAYEDALKTAAKAAYIQSGYDKIVDNYVKDIVPKDYRVFAEKWGTFVNLAVNQKLELQWNF